MWPKGEAALSLLLAGVGDELAEQVAYRVIEEQGRTRDGYIALRLAFYYAATQ
jgi:glycerol dehydrogenase-like iron-containing ADH family enzyme